MKIESNEFISHLSSRLEINKVRVNLFNLSTRPKMELPEPTGEKKIFQEKVFIPVQQHPEVSSIVCVCV